jgi:serine/threonine protein kinase
MPLETLQNGRYHILRPLGSGSMGEVYLVDDTRINRQVAIKVIRTEAASYIPYPDSGTIGDAARLFEREAKAIARLNHPNILPLFDFGEETINGTPFAYMVMPYCADGSLFTWLSTRGPAQSLSLQDVAHFLHQAADALQHAHDNNIIHQDVKPQNFLLRSNKAPRLPDLLLADFGIAKLTAGTSGSSQAIRGTPIYMAPEQWEGQPVPASDQYALAVMIYQLLTGRPPFQGGPGQMMYQHFNVSPQPPSSINPALNKDIDAVILRAMAKQPNARFPSMTAFAQAFQQAMAMDGPTMLNTSGKPIDEGIRTTLAISDIEAVNGTSRTLTLANGQRIRIVVPPGIQNGQVLRVEGQDTTGSNSGFTVPLLLTIAIAASGANFPSIPVSDGRAFTDTAKTGISNNPTVISDAGTTISNQPTTSSANTGTGRTQVSNNPTLVPDGGRTISNNPTVLSNIGRSPTPPPVPPPYYDDANFNNAGGGTRPFPVNNQQPRRRKPSILTWLIIGLVLLLILGSSVFAYSYYTGNNAILANNATATSQANATNTSTSQNNDTSTASANASLQATANAQATATANAQNTNNANATATANAQNSANATATAVTQANINANATATAASATQTAGATSPFTVQSVTMSVNPTSIAGVACGTYITVTYTATFVVASNSPGGTVQFSYTVNNGRGSTNASLTFAAGETTKTYSFTWSGNLPADHTYPGIGEVITSSPNQVTSQGIQPSGQCS